MRGRVVDAATRRPIQGAWVTWRLPPGDVVEGLLPLAKPGDPGITNAQGQFVLERLPDDFRVSDTVYAVAPGYGYAARRAAVSEELVLALPSASVLELVLDPPPPAGELGQPARVRLEPLASATGPAEATQLRRRRELSGAIAAWGEDRFRYRIRHLPAGRYRVHVDPHVAGARTYEVRLQPGVTASLRIARAPRREFRVSFTGSHAPAQGAVLVDVETFAEYRLRADPAGQTRLVVPQARYALRVLQGRSERSIPGEYEPGQDLNLEAPAPQEPLVLELGSGGQPLVSDELGLVRLDAAFGDLLALDADATRPGTYSAPGAPGRYALFLGPALIEVLELPRAPGSPALSVSLEQVEVEFLRPPALEADEVVRGTLSLTPSVLKSARPDLYRRFAGGGEPIRIGPGNQRFVRLTLGRSASYELEVESDLGPFRLSTELKPGQRIQVPLGSD